MDWVFLLLHMEVRWGCLEWHPVHLAGAEWLEGLQKTTNKKNSTAYYKAEWPAIVKSTNVVNLQSPHTRGLIVQEKIYDLPSYDLQSPHTRELIVQEKIYDWPSYLLSIPLYSSCSKRTLTEKPLLKENTKTREETHFLGCSVWFVNHV